MRLLNLGTLTVATFLAFSGVANAAAIQLFNAGQLSGAITTLNFEGAVVNGPNMAFEAGSFIVDTSYSTMHSGTHGLAEATPFTAGPDNLATFTSGVYQVGFYFGNDDLCCIGGFTATLSAYDVADVLIGSVSLLANMNDNADQFLGIQTDTLIFRTVLSYGVGGPQLWGVVDDFSYGGNSLVPEPASLLLFGTGALGVAVARRRKKS